MLAASKHNGLDGTWAPSSGLTCHLRTLEKAHAALALVAVLIFLLALQYYRLRCTTPATPTRGTAGARVSGTFELLENILLLLPMTEVLIQQQQVSRQFRDVIRNSPPLQRNLFLAPASNKARIKGIGNPARNPLILHGNFECFNRVCFERTFGHRIWRAEAGLYNDKEAFMRIGRDIWHLQHVQQHSTQVMDGSWEKMLLTQPHCEVHFGVERQGGKLEVTTLFDTTLKDVIEESRRRLRSNFAGGKSAKGGVHWKRLAESWIPVGDTFV